MSGQPAKEHASDLDKHNVKENVYFASQESDGLNLKRKASFVAEPIHQKNRRLPETRLRAKMQSMHK